MGYRKGARRTSERGASATIVGILLAVGVIFGAAALSIDMGALMVERRELQNGADAGALSLASSCAKDNCVQDADGLPALVNKNASDQAHTISDECVRNFSGATNLRVCDPPGASAAIAECPALPPGLPAGVSYVEVRTSSLSEAGGFVRNIFSSLGPGGESTTTVASCARAGWGPAGGASTLPLTFSLCEYYDALKAGGPGFGDPVQGDYTGEVALAVKYKVTGNPPVSTSPCDPEEGHSGMDAPGGFGWLDQTGCRANINADGWVKVDTGKNAPPGCLKAGDVILVPIFDCVSKSETFCDNIAAGSNTSYHIDGFGAFFVTGYQFPGESDFLDGHPGPAALSECKAETGSNAAKPTCLYGKFLEEYVFYDGTISTGGTDYGAIVVQPLG